MKSRFSDEQIIGILKEHEVGVTVKELCRKYGMSDATYYKWKAKYSGLEINEARRLRSLEDWSAPIDWSSLNVSA
jgi:putative transposase